VIVDYYMGPFSPYKETVHRVPIGDSPRESANLDWFMDLLANVVRTTQTTGFLLTATRPSTCYPDDEGLPLIEMPLKCARLLFNRDYFASMLKQAYSVSTNEIICAHYSWEDEERSFWCLELIIKHISGADDHYRVLLPVLESLLSLNDSLQQWRVALALNYKENGLLHAMDKGSGSNPGFVVAAIGSILKLFYTNGMAAYFMYRGKDYWWPSLENWLTKKRSYAGYEWKKVDNPEEKLLLFAKQLREALDIITQSLSSSAPTEDKPKIMLTWDNAIEDRDRVDRKFTRFTFNKML